MSPNNQVTLPSQTIKRVILLKRPAFPISSAHFKAQAVLTKAALPSPQTGSESQSSISRQLPLPS